MKLQKIFYATEKKRYSSALRAAAVCALCVLLTLFLSCNTASSKPVIIWTNRSEFVPYTELFNASQDKIKVVVVYKENPASSVPPSKDEVPPDIIIGTSLHTENSLRYFQSLNYLFASQEINKSIFYPQLLAAGRSKGYTYLIPVSFNLPAIIFSSANSGIISDNYMLSLDQIRALASSYNEKNASNMYTRMGFAPQWNKDFLYLAAVLGGTAFHEKGNNLIWNKNALDTTVSFLRTWTTDSNTSSTDEQDFAFKYLYSPSYKQVLSGRCLFSYMTSDELFSLTAEQISNIDFRWIHKDNKIPLADSMITLGMYKKARDRKGAEKFIKWFFTEPTQKELINHMQSMHLTMNTFGISGGFSSIIGVNERVFPTYYSSLLANIPVASYIEPLSEMPLRWHTMKTKIILPYLIDAVNTNAATAQKSLEDRLTDWNKQYF
jgi:ABC-type glycerol-3-phosphate transport system substrate-binding protein